jgi:hypothetical protein
MSIDPEPRHDFGNKNRLFTRYAVTLSMDIKTPSVQVWTTVADIWALTNVTHRVYAVATIRYHQCVEITHGDFLNFSLIKLRKPENFFTIILLIFRANAHRSIKIWSCKLKHIIVALSILLKFDLDQDFELLEISVKSIHLGLRLNIIWVNVLINLMHSICFESHELCHCTPNIFIFKLCLNVFHPEFQICWIGLEYWFHHRRCMLLCTGDPL